MKAIVQEGYGAPERVLKLDEVDRPAADDDVSIRVRVSSVNTPDSVKVAGVPYLVRLKSGLCQPSTQVRGTEVAGVVEAVGKNVTDLMPGDEVFGSLWDNALTAHPPGTFAEFTVVPASHCVNKPVRLTQGRAPVNGSARSECGPPTTPEILVDLPSSVSLGVTSTSGVFGSR